jgi:hypothetical protein
MVPAVKQTRLAHLLEGYAPLEKELEARIWDRVFRTGWSPDDPMSLQIAHDTIQESRMASFGGKMAALPGQLDRAVQSALDKVEASRARTSKADRQAIAEQVAQDTTAALHAALPRFERTLHRRTAQRLVLTLAFITLVTGTGGYIWGRHDTARFETQFAAFATRADAVTWISLLTSNVNLDANMSEACTAGGSGLFMTPEGRRACNFPLWLDAPDMPTPGPLTVTDFATDHLTSLRTRSSSFVLLGVGLLLGAVLRPLPRKLRRWMAQR